MSAFGHLSSEESGWEALACCRFATEPRPPSYRGSTTDRALCTLTCSSSRLLVVKERRCLSGLELLIAQGFPATEWAAGALGLDPMRLVPTDLSNHAAVRPAGNAMHSNCMGLMVAWALLSHLCADSVRVATPDPRQGSVRFSPGFDELTPSPSLREHKDRFQRELSLFLKTSHCPVARSVRAPPVPAPAPRNRDLFPLPDLPQRLEGDPPDILRQQARLCSAGLDVLWAGGS